GGPLAAGSRPRVDVVQVDEGFFEALGSEQGREHLLAAALLVLFHRASIAAVGGSRRTLVRSWCAWQRATGVGPGVRAAGTRHASACGGSACGVSSPGGARVGRECGSEACGASRPGGIRCDGLVM